MVSANINTFLLLLKIIEKYLKMTSEGSYCKPKILNVFEVDRETEVKLLQSVLFYVIWKTALLLPNTYVAHCREHGLVRMTIWRTAVCCGMVQTLQWWQPS